MKVRKFIIYTLVYLILIGILIFTLNKDTYTMVIFKRVFTFPVVVWIMAPLVLYACLSILHVMFYSFKVYMQKRAILNDITLFDSLAQDILLDKQSDRKFKSGKFDTIVKFMSSFSPWHEFKNLNLKNDELQEVMNLVSDLKKGEVKDLKKYRFDKSNSLYLKNELNKLNKDNSYAQEILKNKLPNDEINALASKAVICNASYGDIKRFEIKLNHEDSNLLLQRYINGEIEMTRDEVCELIKNTKLSEIEYIKLADKLTTKVPPENLTIMFEKLKDEKPDTKEAYLYLLYEFGMKDKLIEQLSGCEDEKSQLFDALLFLKENGKNFPLQQFIK